MASENDAPSCQEDPNFAIICAFFEKFGEAIGVSNLDFNELQTMLENTNEVSNYLVELHIKLLRKIRKSVQIEKWEKSLIKFCHNFNSQDARELEKFGYKKAKTASKLRILKELLEMQFDHNIKFKTEVNKLTSKELRSQPLGRDKFGHAYWFHSDNNYQIRVYKEDLDDEKWTLVAKNRDGLVSLINSLSDGDRISSDSLGNDDSNSLSEKPIIDTGQQDTEDSKKTSDDDENSNNHKKIDEKEIDEADDSNSSSLKRPRDEDEEADADNDDDDGQAPKKCQIKSAEDDTNSVISDAIEEPVMKIEGEGSGIDNESPVIIGETIEENVMYFYGAGSGMECCTGKQPDVSEASPESSTKNSNDADEYSITHSKSDESVDVIDGAHAGALNLVDRHQEEVKPKEEIVVNNKQEIITTVTDEQPTDLSLANNKNDVCNSELKNETKDDELLQEPLKEEVKEPRCVKHFAYVCGKEEEISNKEIENGKSIEEEEEKGNDNHNDNDNEQISSLDHKEPDVLQQQAIVEKLENNKTPDEEDNKVTSSEDFNTVIKEADSSIVDSETSHKNDFVDAEPEMVLISEPISNDLKRPAEVDSVNVNSSRPIKKAVRKTTAASSSTEAENVEQHEENKVEVKSAESSTANSPIPSEADDGCSRPVSAEPINENNCNSASVESDPLAVSEHEDEEVPPTEPLLSVPAPLPSTADTVTTVATSSVTSSETNVTTTSTVTENISPTAPTLTSFSLDFDESATPAAIVTPSPMRAVRKRGRDEALDLEDSDNGPEKRMKMKNRRQIDSALRKSVEQRIEQLHGSSSDSKESDEEKSPSNKTNRLFKKKHPDNGPSKEIKRNPEKKNSRILAGLDTTDSSNIRPALRQSRRIAQLKIKEQMEVKNDPKSEPHIETTKKGKADKNQIHGSEIRKKNNKDDDSSESESIHIDKKKKKKKEKPVSQIFNENRPWQSSTDDSDEVVEEEEDEEEIVYEDDAPLGELKSDHEFSPESDLENDDDEWQPMKRARTARKESDQEEIDDLPCQKCNQKDHPEWILLCDKCDNGWHCSCLRPPLLGIPEGDWFCPPCQNIILLEKLHEKLVEYDKKLIKKELEDRRKERLAYVGISLNNVLPSKDPTEHRKKKRRHTTSQNESSASSAASGSEYSDFDSESASDEPIYQLRQRRQAKSYKFNEYDEMMKSAIGEEMEKPEDTAGNLGRGKDIQTIVKGLEPEPKAPVNMAEKPPPATLKKMLRKKHRKLNSLESDSEEEDISDEDFKGSSSESADEEEEEEETDLSEVSDHYSNRRRRRNMPVRRSTRARTRRYDSDFINDDSEEEAPKRKKKKSIWNESESENETGSSSWGKKKGKKKVKNRGSKKDRKNKSRIKFGGLISSEEELGRGRRTRGRKATYVESMGSDSEEESSRPRKNPRKIESDDDDEDFIANEEEDEERGSDENQDVEEEEEEEDEEDDEEDDEAEKERLEKRSLLVPKIYIKKPLGVKAPIQKETEVKVTPPPVIQESSNESNSLEKLSQLDLNKDQTRDSTDTNEKEKSSLSSTSHSVENSPLPITATTTATEKHHMNEAGDKQNSENETEEEEDEDEPVDELSTSSAPLKILGKRSFEQNNSSTTNSANQIDDSSGTPNALPSPLFNDLSSNSANSNDASGEEAPKKRRGLGPSKRKTLEESLATIGNKSLINVLSADKPAIEIAAPPQPFSQAQPTPSIITRMLQSKTGPTALYPVGSIRPKQFATMPDDDSSNDSLKTTQDISTAAPPLVVVNPAITLAGNINRGPLNSPYRPHHLAMNHYIRGAPIMREPPQMLGPPSHRPPPLLREPPSALHGPSPINHGGVQNHGIPPVSLHGPPPPALYHHSSRTMDPSPSGGGPINLADTRATLSVVGSSFPVTISQAPPINVLSGQRPQNHLTPHSYQPITTLSRPTTGNYYGNYPAPPSSGRNETSVPPSSYETVPRGSEAPYSTSEYAGTNSGSGSNHDHPPSMENGTSKTYDDDGGGGGEFAGLASYFSSQREDDLES